MIVYFSGTGNSRYAAQLLADRLQDDLLDSFHFIRDRVAAELCSDRPWVFVAPTYAWRLPSVFTAFIRSAYFSGSREAYFIMTCGGGIGNADRFNRQLCREKRFTCKGTLAVVMPENYIALYDAPKETTARRIIAAARPVLTAGAECIREGRDFPPARAGAADWLKSGPVNQAFYRFIVKDKRFVVSEACLSCGKCAAGCPLDNIELQNGKPVWGGHCTHCMACICGCPAAAIEYGRASRGRPRYQCPESDGKAENDDLIAQGVD